jgi:hypothetical protein
MTTAVKAQTTQAPVSVTISKYDSSAAGRTLAQWYGEEHNRHTVELRVVQSDPISVYLPCSCGATLRVERDAAAQLQKMEVPETPPTIAAVVTAMERAARTMQTAEQAEVTQKQLVEEIKRAMNKLLQPLYGNGALHRAELDRIYDLDEAQKAWAGLPERLANQAAGAIVTTQRAKQACEEAVTLLREIRVARALLQATAPLETKVEVARRLTLDPDLRAAFDAAEATGDPDAATKFITDQVGGMVKEKPKPRVKGDDTAYLGG